MLIYLTFSLDFFSHKLNSLSRALIALMISTFARNIIRGDNAREVFCGVTVLGGIGEEASVGIFR